METKFTPGPWFITGKMTRFVEARIDGGIIQEVAACGPTNADGGYGDQQIANARLISAAPDLYEALGKLLVDYINQPEYNASHALLAKQALIKAGDEPC